MNLEFLSVDWIRVTFSLSESEQSQFFDEFVGFSASWGFAGEVKERKGQFGYMKGLDFFRANSSYDRFFSYFWDASFENGGVMIESSGIFANQFFNMFNSFLDEYPDYSPKARITRIDVALDMRGDFNYWHSFIKNKFVGTVKTQYFGDWDLAEEGRTYALGSRQSRGYVRFYEKGIEQFKKGLISAKEEDWLRLEFEFKPQKDERYAVVGLSLYELLTSVKWVHRLFNYFLELDDLERPYSLDIVQPSNLLRTVRHMAVQYFNSLRSFKNELNCSVEYLFSFLEDLRERGYSIDLGNDCFNSLRC